MERVQFAKLICVLAQVLLHGLKMPQSLSCSQGALVLGSLLHEQTGFLSQNAGLSR